MSTALLFASPSITAMTNAQLYRTAERLGDLYHRNSDISDTYINDLSSSMCFVTLSSNLYIHT